MQLVARSSIEQLKQESPRTTFDPDLIDKFLNESDKAAALIRGATIFHAPGGDNDGVYTNQFMAVRAPSAGDFLAQTARVTEAWNELNRKAQPESRLVFEAKQLQIAGKPSHQFSVDIVAADGLPDEPSMRQLMVRLFGPDRKLERYAVQVDDHTVLLAGATEPQVVNALKYLKDAKPTTWNASNTAITNQLTPEAADWKVFFSPAGYVKWLKRANDVTMGDVIGAPVLEPFPLAPPVALAGSFPKGELVLELAVPGDTLLNAQAYRLRRSQRARAAGRPR
jgi:hypothetical protein